jgi:tRNA(fMet)-specific endonuclease VapC
MLKYLLDTKIAIYIIKHRPIQALETFNRHAGQMAISPITLAELFNGVELSAKPDHSLSQVEDFISRLEVLEYGNKAAVHPRSEELTQVSNNLREFERIEGLRLENWV